MIWWILGVAAVLVIAYLVMRGGSSSNQEVSTPVNPPVQKVVSVVPEEPKTDSAKPVEDKPVKKRAPRKATGTKKTTK